MFLQHVPLLVLYTCTNIPCVELIGNSSLFLARVKIKTSFWRWPDLTFSVVSLFSFASTINTLSPPQAPSVTYHHLFSYCRDRLIFILIFKSNLLFYLRIRILHRNLLSVIYSNTPPAKHNRRNTAKHCPQITAIR